MSDKGSLGDLVDISLENKANDSYDTMTIDNYENRNNSLIFTGYSSDSVVGDEEPVSVFYKQIDETNNESAVILNDIKSVEEWLRSRSELDYDIIRNDQLCLINEETGEINELEGTISPFSVNPNLIGGNGISNINWDELVLDSANAVVKNKNYVFVSGPQKNFDKPSDQEVDSLEDSTNTSLSCRPSRKNTSSLPKIVDGNYLSPTLGVKDLPETVFYEKIPETRTSVTEVKLSPKSICQNLPFIKISKNCLMKGKILGKGDLSLLSGKPPVSFLKSSVGLTIPSKTTTSNSNRVNTYGNLIKQGHTTQPNVLKGKTLFKQPNNRGSEKSLLPVKPVGSDKTSKNSLVKLCQSRSILKNNISNENYSLHQISENTNFGLSLTNNVNSPQNIMPVAMVSISTNKSENTTEIVIKTLEGENVYKGKTSDIMKATGSEIEHPRPNSGVRGKVKNSNKKYDGTAVNELMVKLFDVNGDTLEQFEGAASQTHLKCPIDSCKFTSSKGSWMKVHVLQHYGIRPFKCDYPNCTWAFYTNFRLKRHQEVHYKKKVYQCPVAECGRTFSTIYNVNSHLKLHNRPTAVTCAINSCNRAFQTKRSYEKHLREHGVEYAPYICHKEGCGKRYFTINSLTSHSRIHQHSEDELKCSYCGREFDQPCRLRAHFNTHIGVKPYKCDYQGCMWAFTTSSKLRRHQRKHTQTRKHTCDYCEKSFLRSEHLKDHTQKHFVKKSFLCPISDCRAEFMNKSSMYAHLKKHRNKELKPTEIIIKTYPCTGKNCSLVFNTKDTLKSHMQLCHMTDPAPNEIVQDTIQSLSDDNWITLENLQDNTNNSGNTVASIREGPLVGLSDLVHYPPAMERGEFAEPNSSNIITHVVFTDKDEDLEESELVEVVENIGSARTGLPYNTGERDKQQTTLPTSVMEAGECSRGLHSASDVVLSAGLLAGHDNLERSLLLQDELSGGDLYPNQEETGLLGTAGEYQVLLLDASTREQTSEFEQSTINLRDLE